MFRLSIFSAKPPVMIAACLCALGLFAATPSSAALLSTGFEAPEGYSLGNLTGQEGWVNGGGNDASVLNSPLAAPAGTQYFGITRGTVDARASHEFAAVTPTEPFIVDVLLAFNGTTAAGQYPLVYVTNGGTSANSRGVIFGFQSKTGTNAADLVYRNGNDFVVISSATTNTFYRFVAEIDPATHTYDIEVRSAADNALIGGALGAAARQTIAAYTHIGLVANVGGTLYADQLSISLVPEPGSIALAGSAAGIVCVALRRRQSRRQG